MGRRLFVITGTKIKETGQVSFKFVGVAISKFTTFADVANTFGLLVLKDKDDNHVDPWKLAQAMSTEDDAERSKLFNEAVGPDETFRWNVNVFESGGKGLVLGCGVDDDVENKGLSTLVAELPDCVLLMHRGVFDRFETVAKELEIDIDSYHYDGELHTS